MALNDRQRRFCEEFLIDLCATQAARRAGYSEKTAGQMGFDLLKKPEIQTALSEAMRRRSERTAITAAQVLRELARIAFSDLREVLTWGPAGVQLRDSTALDDDAAAAIGEISQTTTTAGGTIRVKLHDKMAALDRLARHLGLFTDLGRPADPYATAQQMRDTLREMMAASGGSPFPDPAADAHGNDPEADDDEPDEP